MTFVIFKTAIPAAATDIPINTEIIVQLMPLPSGVTSTSSASVRPVSTGPVPLWCRAGSGSVACSISAVAVCVSGSAGFVSGTGPVPLWCRAGSASAATGSLIAALVEPAVAVTAVFLARVISKGLLSILNGPAISTLAISLPNTFLGSRHESEHVPPQP
jgi:hypothetical protein